MGKKKSSRKPPPKRKDDKLPKKFDCLFCNHEGAVVVTLHKKEGVGNLHCDTCAQSFQTNINYLSEAIDVYTDWIDAADAVAKEDERANAVRPLSPKSRLQAKGAGGYDDDDDDDDLESYKGRRPPPAQQNDVAPPSRRLAAVEDDDDDGY